MINNAHVAWLSSAAFAERFGFGVVCTPNTIAE